ncbi:MAG TPA: tetratricopeptide repeat protein, partial [bacterium]|nr:tetratricopeptide repeat protein [bacterium]
GLVDEAIDICKEGLEYHPNFVSGMVALARCYFDKGQYTAAIKELEKVVSDVPDNFLAQRLLAESYSLIGDAQNALKSYKMVLFLNPRDEEVKSIVAGMESNSNRPSSDTVAEILGTNTAKEKQEEIELPPPLITNDIPKFDLRNEIVDDLVNNSELGFEERPASQAFNVIGEEEQEKVLTDIGTSTMGELLEKQGHKEKALEVYKRIYERTMDPTIKEKIKLLETSLGIKGFEELPNDVYFDAVSEPNDQAEEKEISPNIIVYGPEPLEEKKQDEAWLSSKNDRLKMLQELLDGFQRYKKSSIS